MWCGVGFVSNGIFFIGPNSPVVARRRANCVGFARSAHWRRCLNQRRHQTIFGGVGKSAGRGDSVSRVGFVNCRGACFYCFWLLLFLASLLV